MNAETYTIPPDNPFVGVEGAREEIWAYGLRNPWKFSFDELNDEVWISDVGDVFEEINKANINSGGLNYGFPCFQGDATLLNCEDLEIEDTELPIYFYDRVDSGQAVIGSYVFRQDESSFNYGKYIFGDFFGQVIIREDTGEILTLDSPTSNNMVLAFGEGFDHSLYLCGSTQIYKIIDNSMSTNDLEDFNLKIYPNPVSSQLNIRSNQSIDEIFVYSMEGKVLQTLKEDIKQVDLSNYPNGVYIITIQSGKITKTHKIVKK